MHKIQKGSYGYIRNARIRNAFFTVLLYAAAFAMFFGAGAYFGTRQNWFSILAILVVLPAARFTVNLVMLFRAKPCSEEAHREIEAHIGHLEDAYDLCFTSEKRNFSISHLVVRGRSVACLTEDPKCETAEGEQHLRSMLQGNGYTGCSVKIFTSLSRYLTRLDQMNDLAGGTEGKTHGRVLEFLKSIAL